MSPSGQDARGRIGFIPRHFDRVLLATMAAVTMVGNGITRAAAAEADEDIVCRISQRAVQKIVDAAFPMDFKGTKEIKAPFGVKVDASYKVKVDDAKIDLREDEQAFTARVAGQAKGFPTAGKVNGKLVISYDQDRKSVIVRVVEAFYPVAAGPLNFTLDVTEDIPEFIIPLALPDIDLDIRGGRVKLSTEPMLTCTDGAIVVTSELICRPSGGQTRD
jgi:hypothetical protein